MKLNEKHLADLKSSGLSDADIERSGCYSVTRQQATVILGFDPQCDGLVFPYPSVNGKSRSFVRIKPDVPFQPEGWTKPAKYLSPRKADNHLYIPVDPAVLKDPSVALIVVEGEKKSLAATAAGFPTVALSGVWCWTSGKDEATGQRHPIPDLDLVMWKGRTVFLIFDSDAATNRKVRQAEKALAEHLKQRGADTRIVRLPQEPDGSKNGLDDFLVRHGAEALRALMDRENRNEDPEADDSPADPGGVYEIRGGCTGWMRTVGRGDDATQLFVPLCNFTARVTEETARDNGVEAVKTFAIEGRLNDGKTLPRIEVTASQFAGLSWVTGLWGISARLSAGTASKDRLREAIQVFSTGAERRTTYVYTGWRKAGDSWLYLHAGGAIGANCQAVDVDLDPPLNRYALPAEPENVTEAVTRSLALLNVAPYTVTVPLLAAVYLAPLAVHLHPDFALWFYGPTGSMKSTLAALFLSHYGHFPDKTALPATWESTENALEKRLFTLKDALAVVDDFAPQADPNAQAKISRVAQRLVRAQGNLSGRSRMRADTSLRPDYPPRGLMISTGEDLPPGQSILARLLSVEVDRPRIDVKKLTEAQDHAHRLPHAMTGYLLWLIPQMDKLKETLPQRWKETRKAAQNVGSHLRGPEIVAHLNAAFEMFLRYAVYTRALSQEKAEEILSEGFDTLISLTQAHDRRVRQEDPAEVFLQTLSSLLAQNAVHVAPKDTVGEGDGGGIEIGWMDESYLYLIPDATRAAVARCLRDSGGHFPYSPRVLYKALEKRGALVPGKDQAASAVKIGPKTRRVLKVPRTALDPGNE